MFMFHEDIKNIGKADRYAEGWRAIHTPSAGEVANLCLKYTVSPCCWANGDRLKNNFRVASWLGLDFDEGMTVEEAKKTFSSYINVIGLTKSHGIAKGNKAACDRFRVFLKLENYCKDLSDYEETNRYFVRKYGADRNCVDGARFFWPCNKIYNLKFYGKLVPIISAEKIKSLKEERVKNYNEKIKTYYTPTKTIPPKSRRMLAGGVQEGERNKSSYQIARDMSKVGISESVAIHTILASRVWDGDQIYYQEVKNTVESAYRRLN